MIRRRFGRTQIQMPVLSCGGMRFQQSWKDTGQPIEPQRQAAMEETLHAGLDLGVNHIETARGYGTSERQLAQFLGSVNRDDVILQTKVGPTPDTDRFISDVRDSCRRLGVERVDLLSLHGINTFEHLWWAVRPGGNLEAARQMQRRGLIGHVGFSTHGPTRLIEAAVTCQEHGGFDYVNLHWYYIWQRNRSAISRAHEQDMGVFIISPTDKGGRLHAPSPQIVDLCAPLHPIVFNTLFCLSRPEVHTLSLGAARPSDFDLQMSALPDAERASQLVGPIQRRLEDAMSAAVGVLRPEDLSQGVPEWDSAPGHINIASVLWLYALATGWGLTDYARERYGLLGRGADWFPGENAQHALSYDIAGAVRGARHAERIPELLAQAHEMLGGAVVNRISTA